MKTYLTIGSLAAGMLLSACGGITSHGGAAGGNSGNSGMSGTSGQGTGGGAGSNTAGAAGAAANCYELGLDAAQYVVQNSSCATDAECTLRVEMTCQRYLAKGFCTSYFVSSNTAFSEARFNELALRERDCAHAQGIGCAGGCDGIWSPQPTCVQGHCTEGGSVLYNMECGTCQGLMGRVYDQANNCLGTEEKIGCDCDVAATHTRQCAVKTLTRERIVTTSDVTFAARDGWLWCPDTESAQLLAAPNCTP